MTDGPGWTAERVDKIKSLWAGGLSGSQIARVIGHATRNSVIAKLHREGMLGDRKGKRSHQRTDLIPLHRPRRDLLAEMQELPEPEPATINGLPVTVMNVTDSLCHYPLGDPLTERFCFCGQPAAHSSSWCGFHYGKVFTKGAAKDRSAA